MSTVVIVARTRMHGDHVCIGGHDLDDRFRGVRLLDWYGDHWPSDSPFMVGDLWNIRYRRKESARPPHVEDVIVHEQHRLEPIADLKRLVLKHARPWSGALDLLFDRTVRRTPSGAMYVPPKGRLPRCSTGYWVPDEELVRRMFGARSRFGLMGESGDTWLTWVGVQEPPERIEAGSLVRVSLSRLFRSETAPEGYYVQISGVLL